MPTARGGLENAVVAGRDGRIYALGGATGGGGSVPLVPLKIVEAYAPGTGKWASAASMPTARSDLAAATGTDGRIYAIGGGGNYDHKDVEGYTPSTNTWATLASMPTARNSLAAATGADGRIYAIGGNGNGGVLNTVEVYTPGTNRWATVAPMPTPRGALSATTGPDGRIYAIGGDTGKQGSMPSTVIEAYTPSTNSWTTLQSMPTARFDLGVATGPDGLIYAIGGGGIAAGALSAVEAYTPATNSWATVQSMPTAGGVVGAATGSDGRIYVIGADSNNLTTVDSYGSR